MPDFGNFQTILLLSNDDARSVHLSQRKNGSDSRKYMIVVFRVRKATEQYERDDEGIRNLGQDLQLAFISAIKTQKKAYDAGSQFVAPIYEVGINSEGAWYATDYFPRGTLHNWLDQNISIDDASLRGVLSFVAAALLDLKQFSGRSHGDLNLSKVLLPGRSAKLRHGVQVTEPLAGSKSDAGQFERTDLRAVGALLYQLVCFRAVYTPDEIEHPVPFTHQWSRLGEHCEYWRNLCNKLLAEPPQHSLESLALELRPPKPAPKWKIYAAAAAVGIVLMGAWLRFSPQLLLPTDSLKRVAAALRNPRAARYLQTKADYVAAINEARQQAEWGEFANSREWLGNAISLQYRKAEAERLLQGIASREAKFNQYLISIPQLIAQTRYAEATQVCAQVRLVAPKSTRVDQWETKANLAAEAIQDFEAGRYAVAERKFDNIWQASPDDLSIKEMRDKSTACVENWGLFDRTKQTNYLELVLIHNPADKRARAELNNVKAREGDYREYYEDGLALFDNGDYPGAAREFEWAVSLRGDQETKSWLDACKLLQHLRERADRFFAEKQWTAAATNYAEIFRLNPKDAGAEARLKECQRVPGAQ